MPLAFQLVGRRFEEALLFALGVAYERVRGPMQAPPGVPVAPAGSDGLMGRPGGLTSSGLRRLGDPCPKPLLPVKCLPTWGS